MNVRDVKVNHVELRRRGGYAFDLQDVPCRMVDAGPIKAQRTRADRDQRRPAYGVATGEECHVMPELHELVGEIRHDTFGPTVRCRRDTFKQRSNLSDSHVYFDEMQSRRHALGIRNSSVVSQPSSLSDVRDERCPPLATERKVWIRDPGSGGSTGHGELDGRTTSEFARRPDLAAMSGDDALGDW